MKRTFRRPDGAEETLEGTPEELAEHERRLREQSQPVKAPPDQTRDVLLGKTMEEWKQWLDELKKLNPSFPPLPQPEPLIHPGPIWIVSCSLCQSYPCRCKSLGWPHGTITVTGTTAFIPRIDTQGWLLD
jgi:hypothetical protein